MKPNKILIYTIGSLGDTVMSIPSMQAVNRHFGGSAEKVVLYNEFNDGRVTVKDVFMNQGFADTFLPYPMHKSRIQSLRSMAVLWLKLFRMRFHSVVYLAPSEVSYFRIIRDRLFFLLCGIRIQIGFHAYSKKILYPKDEFGNPGSAVNEAQCRMDRLQKDGVKTVSLKQLEYPLLRYEVSDMDKVQLLLKRNGYDSRRKLVLIGPGSKQPAKLWEEAKFISVGRHILDLKEYSIAIIGGSAEKEMARRMTAAWGTGINFCGELSVSQTNALLTLSGLCISLDSGAMHLAGAMNVPCIALFSGQDYIDRWNPLGAHNIILRHPVPCSGCRRESCPIEDHPCMTNIEVGTVIEAVKKVLAIDRRSM